MAVFHSVDLENSSFSYRHKTLMALLNGLGEDIDEKQLLWTGGIQYG